MKKVKLAQDVDSLGICGKKGEKILIPEALFTPWLQRGWIVPPPAVVMLQPHSARFAANTTLGV